MLPAANGKERPVDLAIRTASIGCTSRTEANRTSLGCRWKSWPGCSGPARAAQQHHPCKSQKQRRRLRDRDRRQSQIEADIAAGVIGLVNLDGQEVQSATERANRVPTHIYQRTIKRRLTLVGDGIVRVNIEGWIARQRVAANLDAVEIYDGAIVTQQIEQQVADQTRIAVECK